MKYIRSLMIIISLFLSCTVNVFATTSFHINMTYQTLVKKMHSQMEIAGSQSEVQWKSSHPKVASISTSGSITAKKAGTTKITGKNEGKTYTCTVKVYNHSPYKKKYHWLCCYDINAYVSAKTGQSQETIQQKILATAYEYLGHKYSQSVRFGPSYDCSSYISMLYKKSFGVQVGTTTKAMARVLKAYRKDFSKRLVGDMVFGSNGTDNHVGLYLGQGKMIHSAYSLHGVSISALYYLPFH